MVTFDNGLWYARGQSIVRVRDNKGRIFPLTVLDDRYQSPAGLYVFMSGTSQWWHIWGGIAHPVREVNNVSELDTPSTPATQAVWLFKEDGDDS